jgi:hypothetical protein
LTGSTQDTNFPTTQGAYSAVAPTKTTAGSNSAFIAKLNPTGSALVYSTFLGGSQTDAAFGIAVDSAGEACVGGSTTSSDFPVTAGTIQAIKEASNQQAGFVTKLNASGTALVFSTYLSGSTLDFLNAIAVDSNENVYAVGTTNSPDFPVTAGAFQPKIGTSSFGPQVNAFVSEINSAGTALVYSTFLGGSTGFTIDGVGDAASAVAVDGQGMVYLTGTACTSDFPTTAGAFEPNNLAEEVSGQCTGFLAKMNPTPNTPLVYSSFIGGTGNEDAYDFPVGDAITSLAVDQLGNVYVAGATYSVDFPTTAGVVETAFNGPSLEALVTEFNGSEMLALPIPTVTLTSSTNPVLFAQPVTFTATVRSASGDTPTGYVGFNFLQLEPSDNDGTGVGFGPWATVALNGSGVATFTTSSIEALQTPVNAFYLGDANDAPAAGTMSQTVTDIPTATTVTSSVNNVPYGTPVVFTATVLDSTGKPAKGFVFFLDGITYAEPDLDSAGQATWVNGTGGPALPVGTDTVEVEYFPYTGYQKSSGTIAGTFTPLGTTPDPTFTPPAGTYSSSQQVTLGDSNSAALVYYTFNGSTPVPGVSWELPAGFTVPVDTSETVSAVAVAPGYSPSNVVSAAYAINLPPPDFSVASSPASMTVTAGQSGTSAISIAPQNGFNSAVSFSCSGLPSGASCSFSPATVSPSGASAPTTLTIATSTTTAALRSNRHPLFPTALAAVLFCLGLRKMRRLQTLSILAVCTIGLGLLNGCGGGSSGSGSGGSGGGNTQPVTSTITVTATSGTLQHTATISLTVN